MKRETKPIGDERQALELLAPKYEGRWAGAFLHCAPYHDPPYIMVHWAGREREGTSAKFPLTKECLKKIIESGWTDPKTVWGGMDQHERTLNKFGQTQLSEWHKKDEDEARAALVPGIHGWSSLYTFHDVGALCKDPPGKRRLGHIFYNPLNQYFIVFADKTVKQITKTDLF